MNNYLQAYASETTASSNVRSPTEATGAPNGVGSQFNTTNGWVVLDMRDTVLVGEAVQLVWRSQTIGVQARMLVSTSLDGVNWTTASTYYTTSATYGTVTYPLAPNARFIRVQRHSSSTYTSFHLDAVRYYGSTLTGGTWRNLQRDHIFPRATLEKQGSPAAKTNHYANFHFLRGKDNLNKSDTAPHEWFKKPGDQPPYSDDDLKERLLTWELLQPGQFPAMLEERTRLIHERALTLFGMKAADFDALFVTT